MRNIVFTIAAFLLFVSAAFAQGSIEGTVTDAMGKGVANVALTAVDAERKPAGGAMSDGDGAYVFEGLSAGKYTIIARAATGFRPYLSENVTVEDDETATVNITLVAAAAPPKPATVPAVAVSPSRPISGPETSKASVRPPQEPGINVRVGQKFSSVTETKVTSTATVMGQEMETAINYDVTEVYEVVAVEPGSITLKERLSSVRISMSGMGQETTFDSSRNDNSGSLSDLLTTEMARVRTVTISRSGQIRRQDEPRKMGGDEQVANPDRIELFEPELTLAPLETGAVIPALATRPSRSGSYTVGVINGSRVNVSHVGKGQSSGVMQQMGQEMKTRVDHTERSDLQIDVATRLVLSRETVMDNTLEIEAGGMTIPAKGKTTISQKVTRLN